MSYAPKAHLIETKSFKLYLWRFRDRAAFNEAIVDELVTDLFKQAKPLWLRVRGVFAIRGGVHVEAVAEKGVRPA